MTSPFVWRKRGDDAAPFPVEQNIPAQGTPTAATRWLPIRLAPRSGSVILLGRAGHFSQLASWSQGIPNFTWPLLTPRDPANGYGQPTHFAIINDPPGEKA